MPKEERDVEIFAFANDFHAPGDGSLRRGLITIITKRFDVACSTVY